jgi:trigger factor
LKIEKELRDDHQIKLTVEFEAETLDAYRHRAARALAKKVRIPGFRPGKAPYPMIVRTVGEGVLLEETIDTLINSEYGKIIDQAEIEPYGPGQFETLVSTEPLILEFIVPLTAEINLGDYREVRREYSAPGISEEQVNDVLNNLQERQAILEPVERPAQEGDVVEVLLSGKRLASGEVEEGPLVMERTYPFMVRPETPVPGKEEDAASEWPYVGFSRELIGMSAGDEKTIAYTFPEDSDYETLRGAPAEFQLKIEGVKSRSVPALDDEFAASVGDYDSLDALRSAIESELQEQATEEYENTYLDALLPELIAASEIKYPPQMLEDEIDGLIHRFQHNVEDQGTELDTYLAARNSSMEKLREEFREVAQNRLDRQLFLLEVGRAEDIKLDKNELNQRTIQVLTELHTNMDPQEAKQLGSQEVIQNIMANVSAELLLNASRKRLVKIASGRGDEVEAGEEDADNDILDVDVPETTPTAADSSLEADSSVTEE